MQKKGECNNCKDLRNRVNNQTMIRKDGFNILVERNYQKLN